MEKEGYQHWLLKRDDQNIVWLYLDYSGKSMNVLNAAVFLELEAILNSFDHTPPRGVVLASGKPKGFIAGADLSQFGQSETEDELFEHIRSVQILFDRWERLPFPTVALISGVCLGGGTEFALACRYRIAQSEDQSTRIGLPEVKLGLHPGWGGTVRLPKLIGPLAAMPILLSGRLLSAKEAERRGVVDVAVPKRQFQRAALHYILNEPRPKTAPMSFQLANAAWVRSLLGKIFRKKLEAKINQAHYPAPYALIEHWVSHGVGPKAMESEARSIAALIKTATARQLIRIFFLRDRLKRFGLKEGFPVIKRVHVIGAGTMGGDIASWCALKGFQVTLQDKTPQQIAPAIKRAHQLFSEKLKQPHLVQAARDRLCPDSLGYGVCKADLVIEAVFEDLDTKKAVFKKVEGLVNPRALLATNTSSLGVGEIAKALDTPGRLIGLHFFNPVAAMPLIEVVRGDWVSDAAMDRALSFVVQIDRLPLPVASKPGFLVNRILMPYLMEAMELLSEGVPAQAIDQIAVDFGMPIGPIALADTVGLDVCLSVARNLTKYLGGSVPKRLEVLVEKRKLGLKTGEGFYTYQKGRPVKEALQLEVPSDALDRMILRMVNEAVACLSEGLVKDQDLLDAGMVFGAGFAPFRGGVMQYAVTQGYQALRQRLEELRERYGDRFKPVESTLWFQGGIAS